MYFSFLSIIDNISRCSGPIAGCPDFQEFYFLSGLFGVYFVSNGTTPIDTFIQHLQEKWMSMCNSLSDFEVERAKNSLRTNMLLQLDGTTAICEDIGNIFFYFNLYLVRYFTLVIFMTIMHCINVFLQVSYMRKCLST